MLHDGVRSIYEHRPRTCRRFDCRVFAASGVEADDSTPLIAVQSRRWSFAPIDDPDRRALVELRTAALATPEHPDHPDSRLGRALRIIGGTSPHGAT